MLTRSKTGTLKKKAFTVSAPAEPRTVKQALQDPHWHQAMEVEYTALLKTNTWTLVPPPPHGNVIDCKWVFKLKYKPDGSIDLYKARLVSKGFN